MDSIDKSRIRVAVGSSFFLHGICFASWGSRIPDIQQHLSLSEAALGSILFAIPVGQILSSLVTSFLIQKFSSKNVIFFGIIIYSFMLLCLGLASTVIQLIICLFIYGFISNMVNVSANTQAVKLEIIYKKSIMASLHGLWSLAGFCGALIGSLMIAMKISPHIHFSYILVLVIILLSFNIRFLLPDTVSDKSSKTKFTLPDKTLLVLGMITFCSMICEGAMFDWSGIYFKKVILIKPEWIGIGYTAFMSTMAGTRFFADSFVTRFSLKSILINSGLLIALGFFIAVIKPSVVTGIIGFLLIGAGTSAVVPLAMGEAGRSTKYSASSSISIVSTIGFLGFLIGPPLIGWVAGATNLRVSFTIIAMMGLLICFLAGKITQSDFKSS